MNENLETKVNVIIEALEDQAFDKKERELKKTIEQEYKIKELHGRIDQTDSNHADHLEWHKTNKADLKDNRGFRWVIIMFGVSTVLTIINMILKG